jgi:hypothetical protein
MTGGGSVSAQPKEAHTAAAGVVHQALRREVNERISLLNTTTFGVAGPETIDVVCECVRPSCTAAITMTVSDYELVRRFPTRFFVKEGHEVAEGERVVAEADGYVVIEASGRGGLYAVSADPRSPFRRPQEARA